MKVTQFLIIILVIAGCGKQNSEEKTATKTETYSIILKTESQEENSDASQIPGEIDTIAIQKLSEPLKALTAFYSAMGGTNCDGEFCDLTSALGLEKQGSELHKNLIKTYFPDDKVAETVVEQNCYLRPSGASSFSDYEYLTITDKADTVVVDYRLMVYNRGEVQWVEGPDVYVFKDKVFKKVKRNLWSHAEN